MRRLAKIGMVIVLIGGAAYLGMCAYGNFVSPDTGSLGKIPSNREASHSFVIQNTATVILTSDYEVFGDNVGSRKFYLENYWEMQGKDFIFIENTLVLDESVFGEITLKRRK